MTPAISCQLQGMPAHLLQEASNKLPPRFGGDSINDVFLMVKAFVSDCDMSQPSLVVWPGRTAPDCLDALHKIARNEVAGPLS